MKATINDVAKLSGVSIKTVSRVINNEPSVRQLTREKVQTAVKELNYQPNFAARNLAGTKSFTIAYVYDNPNAYYIIDMQEGILSACRQQGFELLINPCNSQQENITEEIIYYFFSPRSLITLTAIRFNYSNVLESLIQSNGESA